MKNKLIDFDLKPIDPGVHATFLVYEDYTERCLETIGYYIMFGNLILFKPENVPDLISVKIAAWKK